jgi:hypothetical protein
MFITKKHISRRTILRGLGATIALPLLDSMVPALTPSSKAGLQPKLRFVAIEMVHGAAGSTDIGRSRNYWSPAKEGADFEFTQTLKSLEPLRKYVTVVSNTELHNAMSLVRDEDGPMADHARSSAVFLTAAHPKRTDADIRSGPSIDQLYARQIARQVRIPSLQLCIEDSSLTGVCGHGYSCAYTHAISWASPTEPLPMERSPRAVFDRLFAGTSTGSRSQTLSDGRGSILDSVSEPIAAVNRRIDRVDSNRLHEFLEGIREVEKSIQHIEKRNSDTSGGALPNETLSVPDSFEEHVDLMFKLLTLAFAADITRVCSFKLGIDRSQRIYPESGINTPFHALSHHREDPEKIEQYAKLNAYHVSRVALFLKALQQTPDGDGNLLDHSAVLYGSPMGDSHVHAHTFLPLVLAGNANGRIKGNKHVRCPEATPMANLLLTLGHRLGVDSDQIGDSTGEVSL